MKDTEKILHDAGETIEYAKQYIEHQKAYFKLDVAERVSKVSTTLATAVVFLLLLLFVLSFLSITIALFIGQAVGSYAMGFLCVTAFYTLVFCFLYVFKKTVIVKPVISMVLKAFFK